MRPRLSSGLPLLPLCLLLAALCGLGSLGACGKKPTFVDPPLLAPGQPKPVFEETQPPATAKANNSTAQLPTNPRESHAGTGPTAPDKYGFPHTYPKPWL